MNHWSEGLLRAVCWVLAVVKCRARYTGLRSQQPRPLPFHTSHSLNVLLAGTLLATFYEPGERLCNIKLRISRNPVVAALAPPPSPPPPPQPYHNHNLHHHHHNHHHQQQQTTSTTTYSTHFTLLAHSENEVASSFDTLILVTTQQGATYLKVLNPQQSCQNAKLRINPLKTKRRLLYLKTHFVPRSEHFSSRL